jgi:hypothetical protein
MVMKMEYLCFRTLEMKIIMFNQVSMDEISLDALLAARGIEGAFITIVVSSAN